MVVFHGSETYARRAPGPVVTIGNFDGVHLGHRALVARAGERARALGTTVCAYTFHPAPRDVLRPDHGIPRIQTLDDRVARLGDAGADEVVIEPFTPELGARDAAWFADEVLTRRLGASAVVVGWDFRFGHGRAAGGADLARLLSAPVDEVPPVTEGGAPVSSSRIREAVRAGAVEDAARWLGRPHDVVGEVVAGDARGRELGFPTANVAPRTALLPGDGVYAVRVEVGGRRWPGVANLGLRPTFGEGGRVFEVHLLDFAGDLYDQQVRVEVIGRVRGERAFPSRDALVAQIRDDVAAARRILA